MENNKLKIIVLGYIVRGPIGGMVTSNLQYLMGLRELGHAVYFLEFGDPWPSCYNPIADSLTDDAAYGIDFAQNVFNKLELPTSWSYFDMHTFQWLGPAADMITEIIREADIVLNLCGVNPLTDDLANVPVRILVDEDPAFTQIKHLSNKKVMEKAKLHTHFFTFATCWDKEHCTLPDDGLPWKTTVPPVFLPAWPAISPHPTASLTTVMQWQSYPPLTWQGREFGLKNRSFDQFRSLPRGTTMPIEIAVGGLPENEKSELMRSGWRLTDPTHLSKDPWTYQTYIQRSAGEFSVAKHGYVSTRSGWFSERSVCYLATGRPVVVQDTGFSDWLPANSAIGAFSSTVEALDEIDRIQSNYAAICQEARMIAEEYFDSNKVLSKMIELL